MPPSGDFNINDQFFSGVYKEVWRRIIPSGLTEVEAEFIIDAGNLTENDSVLDLMCGYGRHSIALAKKGIKVTAVDNSPEYIAEIKDLAAEGNLPICPLVMDALEFPAETLYKTVICMGNSFSFFKAEELLCLFKRIASSLEANGKIIINSWMVAEIVLRHFIPKTWENLDGYKYLTEFKYAFSPSRVESTHTIISPDGKIESIEGVDYIYSLGEISNLCRTAGLKINGFFSTPRKRPFSIGDRHIYIVIEKAKASFQ